LFGMMSKTVPKRHETPPSEAINEYEETQIDSQMTDLTMSDAGSLGNFETQDDSQQRAYSPDWDESLLADESAQVVSSEV